MAWKQQQKKVHYKHTPADEIRLAKAAESDHAKAHRFKASATFTREGLDQEIVVFVYGPTKESLDKPIQEHLENLKKSGLSWILKKTQIFSRDESEPSENQDNSED